MPSRPRVAAGLIIVTAIVASGFISTAAAQSIPLQASIDFSRQLESINKQLIGTVQDSPVAAINSYLAATVAPPWMRLDTYFDGSGPCADGSNPGPLYNGQTNTFDYCKLDARLLDAAQAGARPLVIIDYMPTALADATCASTNGHGLGVSRCPPSDYGKFQALVEAMMMHSYQNFGVADFEVWNEPDWVFFAGTLADYLKIYEASNAAVLAAEKQLGLARGTLHLGGPAALFNDPVWIDGLMEDAVTKPELRVDFISWHIYANDPLAGPLLGAGGVGLPPYLPSPLLYAGMYYDTTEQAKAEIAPFLALRRDLNPKLWIDEWNVNAGWDPRMDNSYGAVFLAAAMHAMQDAGLDRAARFNTWDGAPASAANGVGNWGLFTNDAQVRPAVYEMQMWRGMAPRRVQVTATDVGSIARDQTSLTRYSQNLIASVDPHSGRATILIYNFVPYSPFYSAAPYCGDGATLSATIALIGLGAGSHQVKQAQVDCSTRIVPITNAGPVETDYKLDIKNGQATVSLTVPSDGMAMLTIEP